MMKIAGKEIKLANRDKEEIDLPWGGKLVYMNCIVGGSIDARFMPAILKGIMEKMEVGPLTGSYARDIRVYVYDGKMHPVDSNEISFRLAGRNAFSTAFKNAGPKILEPVYDVEIMVPSDRMGDVISDLQGRRGMVLGMSSEKGFEVIKARVPLAEMNKYSTALSSLTGGRAMYHDEVLQSMPRYRVKYRMPSSRHTLEKKKKNRNRYTKHSNCPTVETLHATSLHVYGNYSLSILIQPVDCPHRLLPHRIGKTSRCRL